MITPKQKADELVKKMYAVHSNSASDITLYFAKQCALIAVQEMIELLDKLEMEKELIDQFIFLLEVKEEIKKGDD